MAKQIPRTTQDLLGLIAEYLEFLPAAQSFKEWGPVWLITAALSRRCWAIADPVFGPLYPNLFVMLTGKPGSGKDAVIARMVEILYMAHEGMEQGMGFHLTGQSLSPKGLIDLLADEDSEFSYQVKVDGKIQTQKYHSLLLCAGEFPTIMPVYNIQLVAFFNDLYNCSADFKETVRGRGAVSKVFIERPHLAMLVGIQPATMFGLFPEQAFGMGFFSRLNLIYTEETFNANPFDDDKPDRRHLLPKIVTEIRSIAQLSGEFTFSPAARSMIKRFANDNPGALKQSRYLDYNTRRWMHFTKASMAFSASESNKMIVELHHAEAALELLLKNEKQMPKVFDNITTSEGFEHTVEQLLVNNKTSIITHAQLERALRRTHRPYEVGQIIASMCRSGDLTEIPVKDGLPKYQVSEAVKKQLH